MKRIFLPLILFLPQFLSAQGWVWLKREGMAGQVAVHCADEGADGHIYGLAEIDYDPYFVKFSPDGELLATQALPADQYYSRFRRFGTAHFLGWGANVVSVFDAAGNFAWSQDFPDATVLDANIADGKILVLSREDTMPYKISRFLADGSPDGEISFQSAAECRFVGGDGGSGFIAAGNYEFIANNYKPVFLKIDAAGNVTQEVLLAGFAAANIERVIELPGGGYVMIGLGWSTADSGIRGHVVKVSPTLTQEWVTPLSTQFQGKQVIVAPDGGLLAVGWGVQDYLSAVKLDAQGAVQWSRSFYKSSQSILMDAAVTSDGGYLLMGQLFGGIAVGVGRILIKTDSEGIFYGHTIKGRVYSDANADCVVQTGSDLPAPGVTVSVRKLFTEQVQSGTNGIFYATADTGAYVLKPLLPGPYWSACTDSVTIQVGTPDTAAAELQLTPLIDCPRMEASVAFGPVRPCFELTYQVRYTNTGTATAPAATLLLETTPGMTYTASSVPLLGQQGAGGYLFGLGDVPALQSATFWVKMQVPCDWQPGDTVCTSTHIFPDTICSNDPDSTFFTDTWCRVVTSSFDPNQKTAYPPGIDDEHLLAPGTEIGYLIDFQNTGTDTAFNVVIYDTLSAWLDTRTIQAGASSHPYELKREGERVLKFVFRDILLPDSNTNEAASHGFVRFYIRPAAEAPIGTLIPNRAAIYFDFNAPVITADCFHTLGFPVSALSQPVETSVFTLWPNPASDVLRIRIDEQSAAVRRISICHAAGPVVAVKNVQSGPAHDFDVSGWPSGAYFVTLESESGARFTKKLVVVR